MIELQEVVQEVMKKRKLADYYYDNYRKFYLRKEYSKASEFIWGVVNALSYSLGLFYGKELRRHDEVIEFLKILAKQHEEIREGISAVQRLHANYFHNFMDENLFEEDRSKAEKLLNKLAELLDLKIKTLYCSGN
jgi:hypothetical protein